MLSPKDIIVREVRNPDNRQEMGIEVIHIKTNLRTMCFKDKSQHRNRALAIVELNDLIIKTTMARDMKLSNARKRCILTVEEEVSLTIIERQLKTDSPLSPYDVNILVESIQRMKQKKEKS